MARHYDESMDIGFVILIVALGVAGYLVGRALGD